MDAIFISAIIMKKILKKFQEKVDIFTKILYDSYIGKVCYYDE